MWERGGNREGKVIEPHVKRVSQRLIFQFFVFSPPRGDKIFLKSKKLYIIGTVDYFEVLLA